MWECLYHALLLWATYFSLYYVVIICNQPSKIFWYYQLLLLWFYLINFLIIILIPTLFLTYWHNLFFKSLNYSFSELILTSIENSVLFLLLYCLVIFFPDQCNAAEAQKLLQSSICLYQSFLVKYCIYLTYACTCTDSDRQ